MITHLQGRLEEKTPTYVVLDCNGIGYWVNISLHTFSKIPNTESLKLYTYLQIKEDAHTLFGFLEKFEREIFSLLISVSGVGASTARIMLSSLSPSQLQSAIGAKTAQRIILDLREKMTKLSSETLPTDTPSSHTYKEEALSALEVLGYPRKVAENVIHKILSHTSTDFSVEELIKQALKQL